MDADAHEGRCRSQAGWPKRLEKPRELFRRVIDRTSHDGKPREPSGAWSCAAPEAGVQMTSQMRRGGDPQSLR